MGLAEGHELLPLFARVGFGRLQTGKLLESGGAAVVR